MEKDRGEVEYILDPKSDLRRMLPFYYLYPVVSPLAITFTNAYLWHLIRDLPHLIAYILFDCTVVCR